LLGELNNLSEEYWKLYDQYAEVRQKLADAEDVIDTTKRQIDDVKAECRQSVHVTPA
jgi:chromosome segregation ATPase